MSTLKTAIVTHSRLGALHCCLCHCSFEVQYVSVCLKEGNQFLGEVCFACVAQKPGDVAEAMRARAVEGSQPVLNAAHQLVLADRLSQLSSWGTTLEQVIQAERACITKRFHGIKERDLHSLVDRRFQQYLKPRKDRPK
jgi:hypothetical protein